MNLADEHAPRLTDGIDIRSLPLNPEQAFVLSRIDGHATTNEIAMSTGLSEETVRAHLTRLHELGAIFYGSEAPGPGPVPASRKVAVEPKQEPRRSSSVRLRAVVENQVSRSLPPSTQLYDPALLDAPADLSENRKKLILDTDALIDRLTHYELLEVCETADKKEIKAAYYQRVGLFHPDRYYGKDLGIFKARLERVFGALTKAHDTLTRKRTRADYDAYLSSLRRTAGVRDSVPPPSRLPPAAEREVEAAGVTISEEPDSGLGNAPTDRAPARPVIRDAEASRRALLRRLSGTRAAAIPPPPPAPNASESQRSDALTEQLMARYGARLSETHDQLTRYLQLAEEATKAGDLVSALNLLKVAQSLDPENGVVARSLREAEERADVELADQFLEQAKYEERDGRMERASRSYERAARGKKSPSLYDRGAMCLVDSSTAPRRAVELARQAIALDGTRASFRVTLARAYALANMPTSAQAEIQRALELAPHDEEVKAWAKRLKQ